MATSMAGQRKTMTKAELDKDKKSQEERIKRNEETMRKVGSGGSGSLSEAVKELGGMANQGLKKDLQEISSFRNANSREQYEHERKAGDPNALKLSFEEWKKL